MTDEVIAPAASRHVFVFRKSLPVQVRLDELVRAMGDTKGLACLDVGATNAMISYRLRKHGGTWQTLVLDEDAAEAALGIVKENVHRFQGGDLPAEWRKSFDVVVIVDSLDRIAADEAFIEECHKVLKPDGRLILNVTRAKTWTLASALRQMLRLTYERRGMVRPGYSESELFQILKNGFDVNSVRFYSRFFVEFVSVAVEALTRSVDPRASLEDKRLRRVYGVAGVLYRLAYQLDMLLLFSRGYHLIALAKRRAWRPRTAPVLVDGRSISEAVLSKALD
jgi:2-polyprenyl-3-methyl-5-hydroxy-6-metoxy-1,4-benzoquinol methylase